jgi:hypothetical protein
MQSDKATDIFVRKFPTTFHAMDRRSASALAGSAIFPSVWMLNNFLLCSMIAGNVGLRGHAPKREQVANSRQPTFELGLRSALRIDKSWQ